MKLTIGFQNEYAKQIFLSKHNCETLDEFKQVLKINKTVENIMMLNNSLLTYSYVIINDHNKEYKFYSNGGNMEIDMFGSEGTGKFSKITGKRFNLALSEFYSSLEDLSSEIMIIIQH